MKLAQKKQNIQSETKESSTVDFQFTTKYPCIICYERCLQPISCLQCNKIMCFKHQNKLNNKCPACRLTPFKYEKNQFYRKLAENQLLKQRDVLITKATFTCLVQGCNFQGKYHKMDIHRRKNHRNEQLKDIIFPQQREKKKKKEILQKLFIKILIRKQHEIKITKKANQIYQKIDKKLPIPIIHKMLWHAFQCSNQMCKQVHADKQMCFIGDENKNISNCAVGSRYIIFFNN